MKDGAASGSEAAPTQQVSGWQGTDANTVGRRGPEVSDFAPRSAAPAALRMIDFGFDKMAPWPLGAVALIVIGPEKAAAGGAHRRPPAGQGAARPMKVEVNRLHRTGRAQKDEETFEDARATSSRPSATRSARGLGGTRQVLVGGGPSTSALTSAAEALAPPVPEYRRPNKNWRVKAQRHAAVVQAAPRRARQGAIGCGARRPVQAAAARVSAGLTDELNDDKPDELAGTEQPFVSHLIELRDRLIRAAIAVAACFGVLASTRAGRAL